MSRSLVALLFVAGMAAAPAAGAGSEDLVAAIAARNQAMAVALIASGADPNGREGTGSGLTVLHRAAEAGLRQVVEALVEKGAALDVQVPYFRGTPLVLAIANRHEDIARFLLQKGANAAVTDSAGYTPLHVAASTASTAMVELLLSRGAKVDTASSIGRTPLFEAISSERWDNARLLIEKGADVHSNIGGGAALIVAARHGGTELLSSLLGRGVDVRAKDAAGWTALHYAAMNGHRDAAELLIRKGADVNAAPPPIIPAAYRGRFDIIKLLVANGADVKLKDGARGNAVSFAAFGGHREIVEWLVARGADVNPYEHDGEAGEGLALPLYAAVYSSGFTKDTEMIRFLIRNGANPNARAKNGDFALSYAKRRGMAEAVEILVVGGAKE